MGTGILAEGNVWVFPQFVKTAIVIDRGHPKDFPKVRNATITLDGYTLEPGWGTLESKTFDLQPYQLPTTGKMSLEWGEIARENSLKQIALNRSITNIQMLIQHSNNRESWTTLLTKFWPDLSVVDYTGLKRYLRYEARLVSKDGTKTPALQDLLLKLEGFLIDPEGNIP